MPTITDDLPCHHCSYNLRTLSTSSLCPECGNPVADSLDDPLPSRTLRSLQLGARLTSLSITFTFVTFLPFLPTYLSLPNPFPVSDTLIAVTVVLDNIFWPIGLFLFCSRIHPWPSHVDTRTARTTSLIASLFVLLIVFFICLPSTITNSPFATVAVCFIALIALIMRLFSIASLLNRATELATFLPRRTLYRQFIFVESCLFIIIIAVAFTDPLACAGFSYFLLLNAYAIVLILPYLILLARALPAAHIKHRDLLLRTLAHSKQKSLLHRHL